MEEAVERGLDRAGLPIVAAVARLPCPYMREHQTVIPTVTHHASKCKALS